MEALIVASREETAGAVARSFERELVEVEKRIERLTDALAAGGELPSLLSKLRDLEGKKAVLVEEMAAARPVPMPPRSAARKIVIAGRATMGHA